MIAILKKEFTPLFLLIGSILAFSFVIALGIIYTTGKCIYECLTLKPIKAIKHFVIFWLRFAYQIWNVLKYTKLHLAITNDLLANVAGGEMIEDCVTTREDTWFGKGTHTISAATGKEEKEGFLIPFGKKFTFMLSKVLGQGHSVNAYMDELLER